MFQTRPPLCLRPKKGEVMVVSVMSVKESWRLDVWTSDGHHETQTCLLFWQASPSRTATVSLSGRKPIWFNSKRKPATDEKTVPREKVQLCKTEHRLHIWEEKKLKAEGECVYHDRYEKWLASWAVVTEHFDVGTLCTHVCTYVCEAACKRQS